MRGPNVVPIAEAKRKLSTAIQVHVPVAGVIRMLTCQTSPTKSRFLLGPPLRPPKPWTRRSRANISSSCFPGRDTDSTTRFNHSSRESKENFWT